MSSDIILKLRGDVTAVYGDGVWNSDDVSAQRTLRGLPTAERWSSLTGDIEYDPNIFESYADYVADIFGASVVQVVRMEKVKAGRIY